LHRYRDPDADHREDFDGPPVEKRAQRRFNKRFSKTTDEVGPHVVQPAIEHEEGGEGGLAFPDRMPTEVETGHVPLREALIRNFSVMWNSKKVEWLKYPNRKKKQMQF
jgi:hypothetical protein